MGDPEFFDARIAGWWVWGRGTRWLRAQFGEWAGLGLAEFRGSKRYYRRLIVPRRANLEAARADAIRYAQEAA